MYSDVLLFLFDRLMDSLGGMFCNHPPPPPKNRGPYSTFHSTCIFGDYIINLNTV